MIMKSIESVIGFNALYQSMLKCKNSVLWKDSVAHFYLNGTSQVFNLSEELKSGTYTPRKTKTFHVFSSKNRDVMGIAFRDRVYQRSLNDNAVYPQMTRHFIYDNAACQKNRGTDFARRRLHCHLQRHYRKHGVNGWVLQCDIKGYYPNMPHKTVENEFERHLDPEIFSLVKDILRQQYGGGVGYLPGSQLLQIAGVAVLNDVDHFIKESLRVKGYIRYMDDFILIHPDRDYLRMCQEKIEIELNRIGLALHPRKTKIFHIGEKIKFLGFYHQLTQSGKVIMLLDPKNVKRERKKLYRLVAKGKRGIISRDKVNESYKSWRAHAQKGTSTTLLRRMDEYYKQLWS